MLVASYVPPLLHCLVILHCPFDMICGLVCTLEILLFEQVIWYFQLRVVNVVHSLGLIVYDCVFDLSIGVQLNAHFVYDICFSQSLLGDRSYYRLKVPCSIDYSLISLVSVFLSENP